MRRKSEVAHACGVWCRSDCDSQGVKFNQRGWAHLTVRAGGVIATLGLCLSLAPAQAASVSALESVRPSPLATENKSPRACPMRLPVGRLHQVSPNQHQQVVIARGESAVSSYSVVERWQFSKGCWILVSRIPARNGYSGWHASPWDWSGYSPIGTYSLSDAGGR